MASASHDEDDEDNDNLENIALMVAPSGEILVALLKRLNITKILNKKMPGRTIKGSKAYLPNAKLNEGDRLILSRHLTAVLLYYVHIKLWISGPVMLLTLIFCDVDGCSSAPN